MFEDAMDMAMLYSISPELTCQCDEVHTCQQCYEEDKKETCDLMSHAFKPLHVQFSEMKSNPITPSANMENFDY
jgi:hypothetical protein